MDQELNTYISFIAVSEPTLAFYALGKNSFGSGTYWKYNKYVEETVQIFDVENKIRWVGNWGETIDGTIGAEQNIRITKSIFDVDS